jgi:hypothetical protein
MTIKSALGSIAEYGTCLILYYWLTVGIHEYLHLSVLRWLGGDGHIILTPYGGAMLIDKMSAVPYSYLLTSLAGGIGVALIYGLLALWNWKDGDIEEWAALLQISAMQLGYGIYEGIFLNILPFQTYLDYAWIPSIIGFGIVAVPSLWLLVNSIYAQLAAE